MLAHFQQSVTQPLKVELSAYLHNKSVVRVQTRLSIVIQIRGTRRAFVCIMCEA